MTPELNVDRLQSIKLEGTGVAVPCDRQSIKGSAGINARVRARGEQNESPRIRSKRKRQRVLVVGPLVMVGGQAG